MDTTKFIKRLATVAPLVGAWIEIENFCHHSKGRNVAPLVGAWIEISVSSPFTSVAFSRSSCRSVD